MYTNLYIQLKKHTFFLLSIIILSLVIRFIFFIFYSQNNNCHITIDSGQYNEIAIQYSQDKGITNKNSTSNFLRLPGYPIFLGTLYRYIGPLPFKAMIFQILLSCIIPILIFLLSITFFPNQLLAAKLATIASELHPGFILFAGKISSETLFLIFFLMFIISFFIGFKNNKLFSFHLSGIFLGIASLIRANGIYIFYLSVILILLATSAKFYKKIQSISIFLFSWFSIFGSWIIRNYVLTGFIFMHTLVGQHFLRYNAVHILMDKNKISWQKPFTELFEQRDQIVKVKEKTLKRNLLEVEKDNIAFKLAIKIIKKHPFLAIKDAIKQILRTTFSLYSLSVLALPPNTIFTSKTTKFVKLKKHLYSFKKYPILIFFFIWDILFNLLMILGLINFTFISLKTKKFYNVLVIILPLIIATIGLTLSCGLVRLRFPIEPFLIVLGSYGLTNLYIKYYKISCEDV